MDGPNVSDESDKTLLSATDPAASSVHNVANDAQTIVTGAALDGAESIDYIGRVMAASNAAVISKASAPFSAGNSVDTEERNFANDFLAMGWIPRGRTNRPSAPKPNGEPEPIPSQIK
ncbi:hypothetical protein EIP86_002909 [Pleurotus ostreatoroseus]|nr:hypothetical protein EIP86_002909 [Pleurotus ostreatoroseus]